MAWLDIFKRKVAEKQSCFLCARKAYHKDGAQVKYRYGEGSGNIGTAFICNQCEAKYSSKKEDDEYGESL